MTIDIEYVKLILEKFIVSETNYIRSGEFKEMINNNFEKFTFHWELLLDNNFIINKSGKPGVFFTSGIGFYKTNIGLELRLHDKGHKFYDMLSNDTEIYRLKNATKALSMDFLIEASKQYMNVKMGNLF